MTALRRAPPAPHSAAQFELTLPFPRRSTGKVGDIKRCHALRGVLELFDFDDASIESLKKLLLRAAFAPAFLKPAEGRRFLSHLFTLHAGLTRELYVIVRNQIPTGAPQPSTNFSLSTNP